MNVMTPMVSPRIMIPALGGDGVLYPIEKLEAHQRAVPHLAVSVFVFDGDAMLLQRRALTKYRSMRGGLSNTARPSATG
jgi:hypothetical protein